jgi:3-hydroxyacyl-[acyl-carrier-protein] dehydratase
MSGRVEIVVREAPAALEPGPAPGAERFSGEAELGARVRYFEGHFPEEPILPGMAQLLCLVVEPALGRWPELGAACGLSKVKFRRPIRPGDTVSISLERQGDRAVRFSLACGDSEVASGVVLFGGAPR